MSAELCTDQGDRIKTAVESFKDFGPESIIVFRKDEVEIIGQDHAHVVDIRFILTAEKIRETGGYYKYNCIDDKIELGVRTKVAATALKRFSPGDKVIIGARKGAQRDFYISIKNKGKIFTSEIIAPMISPDNAAQPNLTGMFKYNGSIVMNSSMFHGIVGDLMTSEPPIVMFDCDGSTLKLSGDGMFSKSCVDICDSSAPPLPTQDEDEEDEGRARQNKAVFQKEIAPDDKWKVHESFATNHLQRIAKAKNISSKITIYITQDKPASFEYDTPIGKLTYIVSARTVEDIDDPKLKGPEVEGPLSKKRRFDIDEPVAEYNSDGMVDDEM